MTVPLDRIPDSLGYLVLAEDGAVLNSGGELENAEQLAGKFAQMVYDVSRIQISSNKRETFRKISVIMDTFMYVITVSNHKIFVIKRRYIPQEPDYLYEYNGFCAK